MFIDKLNKKQREKLAKDTTVFLRLHNEVCIDELENILETLMDMGMLNRKGVVFRNCFWEAFIKKEDSSD